jgi:hypothetical protein
MRKTPLLLFLLPTVLFADEVVIKDAGTISGRIVEQTATMVTVDIGGGIIGVPLSHVDHIIRARTDLDEYDERASRLGPQDALGWQDLARWASRRGMDKQADQAFERVLAIEPDDPEARLALGFVPLHGSRVPEEEGYRARGLIKFEGEWMTLTEAQWRQDSAAAEQARQDARQAARAEELERLKAELQAQYAAEAAADEAWRAEGAAWFYSRTHDWGGWGFGTRTWSRPLDFHRHARRSH